MATTPLETYLNDKFCDCFCANRMVNEKPRQRLLKLTELERYQGLHDLHGVPDAIQETPELIAKTLEELEAELDHLTLNKEKSHYKKALELSPQYVKSQRLKFLRAKNFNAKEAARLFEMHFDLKEKLFGEDKLVRDIQMSDLTPEDIKSWKTGYFQVLPNRDLAGRRVFVWIGKSVQEVPSDSTIRIMYVITMKCIENEIDQKRGIVTVYYGVDQGNIFKKDLPFQFATARDSLPVKGAANHFAYNNPYLSQFMVLVEVAMSIMEQSRFRTHFGTHLEVQYNLMAFGIPREYFPVSAEDGNIDMASFQKGAAVLLRELEDHNSSSSAGNSNENDNKKQQNGSTTTAADVIELDLDDNGGNGDDNCLPKSFVPGPHDVIMGRFSRKAPGNVRMRQLLEENRAQYDAAGHFMEKMVVNHHIFTSIKERGGRFVNQRKDKRWEEVSDDTAREKISLGFRNLRRLGPAGSTGPNAKKRRSIA